LPTAFARNSRFLQQIRRAFPAGNKNRLAQPGRVTYSFGERERIGNLKPNTPAMNARTVPTATLVLLLTAVLGACGPGNTLSLRGNGDDSRLGAVESGLRKVQGDVKALEHKQAQTEAHIAELQKRLGVAPGQAARPAPPVPQASALGQGFAHPPAEQPGANAAEAATPPAASPPSSAATGQTQTTPEPAQSPAEPAPAAPAPPATAQAASPATPPAQPPVAARPQPPVVPPQAVPPAKAQAKLPPEPKNRHGKGWIGPPASSPGTPEAAIAADRAEGPAKAERADAEPAAAPTPTPSAPKPAEPAAAAPPPVQKPAEPAAKEPEAPVPGNAQAASPVEKAEYNQALQLAINGRQAEAKAAFDQFMAAHPQSPLAPNALYWMGEGAYQRGDFQAAIGDFEKVAKGWPGHHKAADSLYKIAQVQERAGDTAAARATLERYLRDYPNAELAGTVRQKLQALPK
jgi:tol-pal system protein YbgF